MPQQERSSTMSTNTPKRPAAQGGRTKEFNRSRFIWLDQVMADHTLPPSVFKVAYYLNQRFNEGEGGAAWPSFHTIANVVGLSKSVVHAAVRQLQENGHLAIEAGRQGRGHSNRYLMVVKVRQADLLEPAEKVRNPGIKVRKPNLKGRPTELTLSTHTRVSKETPSGRERITLARDDDPGEGRLDGASPDSGRKQASGIPAKEDSYAELRQLWNRGWTKDETPKVDAATRCAFAMARHEGTMGDILDGARAWVKAADAPRFLPTLAEWLDACGWKQAPPRKRGNTSNVRGSDIARQWANQTNSRMGSMQ
jgi:hypothetical protein